MKGIFGSILTVVIIYIFVYLRLHYKKNKLSSTPMNKGIYTIIVVLIIGLIISFWLLNNQQQQIDIMKQSISELNKPITVKPVTDDIETEVYELEKRIDDLEGMDADYKLDELESRVDNLDADIEQLFRYSHSH